MHQSICARVRSAPASLPVLKSVGTGEERGAIAPPNFGRNRSKCAQSRRNQIGRKEAEQAREERGAIVSPDFGRNRSKCAQGSRNYGGKRGNCPPKFWQESQQMCSRPLELVRKGGQLRPQILKGIAANVLKAVGTRQGGKRQNQGGKGGNCVPRFWQESQQMFSRSSELWRKEGQLPSQLLARIAANVLKAVGTSEERGTIASPNFERNCSKCAQGRWNQGEKECNCTPKFWKELQQMCSGPLELGRKGGQLLPIILAGIAAHMLKAVETGKEKGAIAPLDFGRNRSKTFSFQRLQITKGHFILKCPFGVIVLTKKQTKFLPQPLKRG